MKKNEAGRGVHNQPQRRECAGCWTVRLASRPTHPVLKRFAGSVENFFPERFSARHRAIAPLMFATAVVVAVLAMTFRLW
ncbi:MAG: hypothetical protein KGJ74_15435 [Betaproteobacteria bacterium]|nr:hypothetical protein [Betaproteobacteria bacterium]